jgi:hypothetical protein
VKCGGLRYPAWTETERAHISFTHSATIDGPRPSIFKSTQAPTSISPCRQRLLSRSSNSLPFLSPPFGRDFRGAIAIFLSLLVPVVVAACCASNRSQIWGFSVFFGGQNWWFFCLRLFLLFVCLFVWGAFHSSGVCVSSKRVILWFASTEWLSFVIVCSNSQRFL